MEIRDEIWSEKVTDLSHSPIWPTLEPNLPSLVDTPMTRDVILAPNVTHMGYGILKSDFSTFGQIRPFLRSDFSTFWITEPKLLKSDQQKSQNSPIFDQSWCTLEANLKSLTCSALLCLMSSLTPPVLTFYLSKPVWHCHWWRCQVMTVTPQNDWRTWQRDTITVTQLTQAFV